MCDWTWFRIMSFIHPCTTNTASHTLCFDWQRGITQLRNNNLAHACICIIIMKLPKCNLNGPLCLTTTGGVIKNIYVTGIIN